MGIRVSIFKGHFQMLLLDPHPVRVPMESVTLCFGTCFAARCLPPPSRFGSSTTSLTERLSHCIFKCASQPFSLPSLPVRTSPTSLTEERCLGSLVPKVLFPHLSFTRKQSPEEGDLGFAA